MANRHVLAPRSWLKRKLGDLIRIGSGQVDPKQLPYAAMTHVGPENIPEGGGRITGPLCSASQQKMISGKYEFDSSCVLYSKIRPNLNKVVIPSFAGICSADIYPVWPHVSAIKRDFLFHLLRSSLVLQPAIAASGRTGLPKINRVDLEAIVVSVPPIQEQEPIAAALSTWDTSLQVIANLTEAKQVRLSARRESLLTGTPRIRERRSEWPMTVLDHITKPLTARCNGRYQRDDVMGVLKNCGLVPMREHVIADDIRRYLIVPPKAFAYNPMRINIGSIAMSSFERSVIVSPDYVVFACDPERILPDFLNHLRKTRLWSDFVGTAGNGSVRVRIYYETLADFEFRLPPLSEQHAIVELLNDAEREIALLTSERQALEKQRDALATELLTGRLRVPKTTSARN
jgi:type I restriction enzyme, S subunit